MMRTTLFGWALAALVGGCSVSTEPEQPPVGTADSGVEEASAPAPVLPGPCCTDDDDLNAMLETEGRLCCD